MTKVYDNATDLITFARGSSATYLDSDGVLKTAVTDIPRIEYGSDGSLKGLLIEEQRTNLVTHSEDFSNAAWDKVGTIAIDSTLVTGPDGALSGRRVLNFADAAGDRLIEFVSITNATLTGSIWVKGEGANIGKDINLTVKRSGGTYVGTDVSHTLTADWERIHATFTQDPTNTGARIVLVNPNNGNEASEVLIYGAQFEEGSFATSYIPTSGSTATRSADIASIPVTAFGYNQSAGTVVVECQHFTPETTNPAAAVALDDGSQNNRLWYYQNKGQWIGSNGGVTQFSIDGADPAENTELKAGMVYSKDDFALYVDGVSSGSDTSGSVAEGVTTLHVGKAGGVTTPLNGHIKSIQYYPRRLTDAQLQELTA